MEMEEQRHRNPEKKHEPDIDYDSVDSRSYSSKAGTIGKQSTPTSAPMPNLAQ
jgi:hypothetical protein